jgi:hypothetical protein
MTTFQKLALFATIPVIMTGSTPTVKSGTTDVSDFEREAAIAVYRNCPQQGVFGKGAPSQTIDVHGRQVTYKRERFDPIAHVNSDEEIVRCSFSYGEGINQIKYTLSASKAPNGPIVLSLIPK